MSSQMGDIEASGIYTDLMRKFRDDGHIVHIVFPLERRMKQDTELKYESGVYLLGVKTLNVTKTSVIEKGVGQMSLEPSSIRSLRKCLLFTPTIM